MLTKLKPVPYDITQTAHNTAQAAAGPGSHLAGEEGNEFSCLVFVAAGSRLASLWLLHLSWRISQPHLTLRVFWLFNVMLGSLKIEIKAYKSY